MKRIVFLDYIRVIACFMVMLVHASENFYGAPAGGGLAGPVSYLSDSADALWVSVYDGLCRVSVPLFMIVSAFLLVPVKEGQTTAMFYRRRAERILPAFFIFLVIYSVLPLLWGGIDTDTSRHDLAMLLFNFPSQAGHLWFIYPLIGLYLFIPVVSPWLAGVSEREERFFVILFLVSTCMPYLNRWLGDVWGQCFWNEFHTLWYFSGYLGYLALAHYIRVHLNWSRSRRMAVGMVLAIAGSVATVMSFYLQATPGVEISTPMLEIGWSFCTINVVAGTTGVFLLFTCMRRTECPRMIAELSELSYGMYLMHMLWLPMWTILYKADLALPTMAAIPCIAVSTFVSCGITAKVLSLIPGGGWLLGTAVLRSHRRPAAEPGV